MKTALVRTKNGNLKIHRTDEYTTNKELYTDLKGNGYKILKIWDKYKTDKEVDDWELLNRK